MSPREPPIRISDASVSRYAFDTHCCAGSPPPRSRSIAGSATLTIVPSIVATPEPRIAARSVSLWRRVILREPTPRRPGACPAAPAGRSGDGVGGELRDLLGELSLFRARAERRAGATRRG